MSLYVYGVMRADDLGAGIEPEQGEDAHRVEVIVHEDLAVLVSAIEGEPVRLRREAVVAHSDVLQWALAHGPVLPLRFGTVMPGADALRRDLLQPRREEFRARLDDLADKAEFRLKVSYREQPVLRSILAGDPELRRSADSLRGLPAEASHFQRVRLGERMGLAVQGRRYADVQQLIAELEPIAVAVEIGAPQQPLMVLNASVLIAEAMRGRFDATVERLARERAELMEFKLIGPLPAHSFVNRQRDPLAAPAAERAG